MPWLPGGLLKTLPALSSTAVSTGTRLGGKWWWVEWSLITHIELWLASYIWSPYKQPHKESKRSSPTSDWRFPQTQRFSDFPATSSSRSRSIRWTHRQLGLLKILSLRRSPPCHPSGSGWSGFWNQHFYRERSPQVGRSILLLCHTLDGRGDPQPEDGDGREPSEGGPVLFPLIPPLAPGALLEGRDGDLPLLVHRRPLHHHSYHPLQPLLFSHMAWSPAACLQWDRWTGKKKTVRTFFRKRFVRWLMRSWSQRKLSPGLPCHVQYNDKEFQGCRSSRLLWKRRSGCGQMGLRCRATVSRCGIEEAVDFDVKGFLWKGNMIICWLLHLSDKW